VDAGEGRRWHLLDVPAVSGGLGHDHAEGVEDQAWQPQQLHAVANEGRGDDVVHKEGALVWQEDAPGSQVGSVSWDPGASLSQEGGGGAPGGL
jgi:hypothetical protein